MTKPVDTEKMLNRVRGLLAKADDQATSAAEADLYRAKAEDLMRKYRISEEQALAADPASLSPEWVTVEVIDANTEEFGNQYYTMWYYIAKHVGVRHRTRYVNGALQAQTVGYPVDLKLAEMMYTSARLGFSAKLTPGVDPNLSEAENIYRLRSAGIVRAKAAEMLWGKITHQLAAKVGAVYKEECARRGETPALDGRSTSAKLHREVYADEFAREIVRRLWAARDGADRMGGLPALHGREERVTAAFYERYPEERPSTDVVERKPCTKCEKRKDGMKCADHRYRPPTKAERAEDYRRNRSATAVAARRAGRSAAQEVPLDGSGPARRLDDRSEDERENERDIRGVLGS
jgi:hypothetical protein